MNLVSLCPLRATSFVWGRVRGGLSRTIVCKATFLLGAETMHLAEQQEPLNEVDGYWDDNPARSLYAPNDLVPRKAKVDVLLVGRAFAEGEPVTKLVARLRVGTLDKSVEVHCDRVWSENGKLVFGPAFTSMPLVYERAAGGPQTWNPVGVRADAKANSNGGAKLPNLTAPGFRVKARGARIAPVGFGPVAPTWPDRVAKLGGHTGVVAQSFQAIPDDLDFGYFNAAPRDQQVEELRGDEPIILENLDPLHAHLVTALPGLRPRVFIERTGPAEEVPMIADTLWIDTDRRICTVTWRGATAIEREDAERIVVAMDEPRHPATAADIVAEARLSDVETTHVVAEDELDQTERAVIDRKPVLPFHRAEETKELKPQVSTPALAAGPSQLKRTSHIGVWGQAGDSARVDAGLVQPPRLGAPLSALAASNAAAHRAAVTSATAANSVGRLAGTRSAPHEIVDLLWHDKAAMPRIRAERAWKSLFSTPSSAADRESEASDKRKEAKEQRAILTLLRDGDSLDRMGLDAALDDATHDGMFTPTLVLTSGTLELTFDERETLRVTLGLVAPLTSTDKRVKELSDAARERLESPWLEKSSSGLETFVAQLREAYGKGARGVAPGHLEAQTERILLEQRSYQKRTLLGEEWIRALLLHSSAEPPTVLYVPRAASTQLPLFVRFRAKIVTDLRFSLDQFETSASALSVVAIARVVDPPRR